MKLLSTLVMAAFLAGSVAPAFAAEPVKKEAAAKKDHKVAKDLKAKKDHKKDKKEAVK